ncbi:glycosyltransferase [Maricaulis sp.]|uniref:glycosyltransferase n=1 Tax=Maricaulis sp. TaxID=1486257 RepID=UPI001B22104C|nr:glycosyltransferase [Maricaulis sp.]MBO6763513.1 glycosyltransferase family 1 protein [Maricaulis sp.]
MRIAIHAFGTRGDVQPYIALGLELQGRGHDVTLSVPRDFTAWVEGFGLAARAFDLDMGAYLREADALGLTRNPLNAFRYRRRMVDPMIEATLTEGIEGARGADIVVAHPKCLFSATGAEAAGAGFVMTAPLPAIAPTHAFPMPGTFAKDHGRFWNRLSWRPLDFAMAPFRKRVNAARVELGLDPVGSAIQHDIFAGRPCLRLIANSPLIVPRPDDWDAHTHLTGYWMLDDPAPLDPALEGFLNSGPPPVYVGFGSMVSGRATELAEAAIDGLRRAGLRGVIARGWANLPAAANDSIHVIDHAPHDKLFPRCRTIVHHGGAGTTAAALSAGRPSLIVPFMVDQPWWGERLREQGLGPAPLRPARFTANRFARALKQIEASEVWRARCTQIGKGLAAENGAAIAADRIEHALIEGRN